MALKVKIYINRHVIASNKKHGKNEPPITVATYKERKKCHEVIIDGKARIIYSPNHPLSCGATVYIETDTKAVRIMK